MGGDLGIKDPPNKGGHILTVVWPSLLSMPENGALGEPRGVGRIMVHGGIKMSTS